MDYWFHEFPNGLRLIHQGIHSNVSHLAVFIQAGSRDEKAGKEGLAHLVEHNLFKGTKKRNAFQVMNRIEAIGADFNAFTTKEETCLYASFLSSYYPRVIELFGDILLHSAFPKKEIENEKEVVLNEIASYEDDLDENLLDEFENRIFDHHPLGHSILGTASSVSQLSQNDLNDFMAQSYNPSSILMISAGDIQPQLLTQIIARYFEDMPIINRSRQQNSPAVLPVFHLQQLKPNHEAYYIMGIRTVEASHPHYFALNLLNNILGGNSMTSRLNLSLREKHGLTYNIESNYTSYSDAGYLYVYFQTSPENISSATKLIQKELKTLSSKKLGYLQLSQAKRQYLGQTAIAWDIHQNRILNMGRQMLSQGRIYDPHDISLIINQITAEQLQEIAIEYLDYANFSTLMFYPDL